MTACTMGRFQGAKGHTALVAPGVGASAAADGATMASQSMAAKAEGGGDLPSE
jgi:hypothetical protein